MSPVAGAVRFNEQRDGFEANGDGIAKIEEPPNNELQLTRSARCAPSPSVGGQSLRAALAAEPGCSAGREAR